MSEIVISRASREQFLPLLSPVCEPLRRRGVRLAGYSELTPPYRIVRPCPEWHSLNITLGGAADFRWAGGDVTLGPGTTWVVPAGVACQYSIPDGGHWHTVWFHLNPLERRHGLRELGPHRRDAPMPSQLVFAVKALLNEVAGDAPDAAEAAHACAQLIGVYIDRLLYREPALPSEQHEMHRRLQALWFEVDAELHRHWTLGELADRLRISESSLQRLVGRLYGTTAMARVAELRMRRARELLGNSSMSLEEIARSIGYETAFAFSKAFKRWTGAAPGEFRRRCRPASPRSERGKFLRRG